MSIKKIINPVIAVVTDIKSEPPFFKSIQTFCQELQRVATLKGYQFYVFTISDFHSTHVNGYYFNDHQWMKATFPHPIVIYNRIHSRKFERSDEFLSWKKQIKQLGIPLFNDRFLSKWDVHKLISTNKQLHTHIPETRLYTMDHLEEMVYQHSVLFLKPIHGSQGRNILRITSNEEQFLLEVSGQTGTPIAFENLLELLRFTNQQIANRSYLIQQGITLIDYENRSLDSRVLCHLHSNEYWEVSSIVARATATQQFVSNISQGGELVKPLTALATYFNDETSYRLLSKLKKFATMIATTLHEYLDGFFGEFGIDIGIDTKGGLWLIEVNSKPSKNFPSHSLTIRPSARAIIHCCKLFTKSDL